jgi:microcystin-dependent protein
VGTPYIGEIKIVSFNYAPKGWALCNGQVMQINGNQPLFSLYGTTFGGDGRTTFGLPNLQGRAPVHRGSIVVGQVGGEATHTLAVSEMPTHVHQAVADSSTAPDPEGTQPAPNKRVAGAQPGNLYGPANQLTPMNAAAVGTTGGGQAHENRQPYLTLNFIVALQGVFPSRN